MFGMSGHVAGFSPVAFDRLAKKIGVTVLFLSEDQMRLWGDDLIIKTPPLITRGAQAGKRVGEQAISTDFQKIFKVIDRPEVFEAWAREKGGDIWRTGKNGRRYRISAETRRATLMRAEDWHLKHRSKRTGRTFKPKSTAEDAWSGRQPVRREYLKAYLRERQKHVGTLAAGWLPATEFYAGRVGKVTKAPGFVKRQGRRMGFHVSAMSKEGTGYLQGSTSVPWAREKRLQSLVAATSKTRELDMKNQIMKRQKRILAQFNMLGLSGLGTI